MPQAFRVSGLSCQIPAKMLENYWYIACKAESIKKGPHAFVAFDKPLVAFTGANGKPGVLLDRCAHRNAPLSRGAVRDGQLQCPYHGWSYDTDGRLADLPVCPNHSKKTLGAEEKLQISVEAWPAVERDGYIWFSLSHKPHTPEPPAFPFMHDAGWTSFSLNTLFDGPVEVCLENFLDCPHATFVHRGWFRTPTTKKVKAIVRVNSDGAEAEYFDEPREASVVWSLLSKKKSTMRHIDRFIAPATSRVDYEFSDNRYYVITSSCTPINEKQTRVHTVISFRFGGLGWFIKLFFKPLSQRIISQDVEMVKLQQQNVERFDGKLYKVIPQDLLYKHIVQWRNCIKADKPLPQTDATETIDLVI